MSRTIGLVACGVALATLLGLYHPYAFAQCTAAPGAPTWRLNLDTIRVDQVRERDGDRPYFASLVFRSCFSGRGTSRVELIEREPHDWVSKAEHRGGVRLRRGDHMSNGESLRIPSWMGRFEWSGIPLVAVAPSGLPTDLPWLFGVVIVSFDNNNTPPHVIRNIMQTLRGNLQRILQQEVETGNVLTWTDADWGRLQEAMSQGVESFGNAFQLTVGSAFNPDKPTGIQLIAFHGTTGPLPIRAPRSPRTINLAGDRVQLFQRLGAPRPESMPLEFSGSGARYTVAARLERVGGESVSWRRINERPGAVSLAACGNGRVYALVRDGGLASVDGASASGPWQSHGRLDGATRIACAGTSLFFLGRDRQLFELRAPEGTAVAGAPRRLGRPWAAATIAAAFHGDFPAPWALNDDRTLWVNREGGTDGRWVRVGQPTQAVRIAAAPGRVFALNEDRTLWISETGSDGSWRRIDRPHAAVEVTATARAPHQPATLYALNTDGSLWRGAVTP